MNIRRLLGSGLVAALLASAAIVPAAQARPHVHPLPAWAHEGGRAATQDSANWSGYAVLGTDVTAVYSTFTVPAVRGAQPGFAATWAGIGGATTTDLIQAGVEENNDYGAAGGPYYAWYEMLPDAEVPIQGVCDGLDPSCSVAPGDKIYVDIHLVDGDRDLWSIHIEDIGSWKFSKTVHYLSSRSSADWIFEAVSEMYAPTFVPHVDNTTFGPIARTPVRGNQFSISRHRPQRLATGNPDQENMSLGFVVPEAAPSPIAPDGNGFTACAYSSNCPAPAA